MSIFSGYSPFSLLSLSILEKDFEHLVNSIIRFYQRTKAAETLEAILVLVRWQCCVVGLPAKLLPTTRALENIGGAGQRFGGSSDLILWSQADRLSWRCGRAMYWGRRKWPGRRQLNLVSGIERRFAHLNTLNPIHPVGSGFTSFMFNGAKQQASIQTASKRIRLNQPPRVLIAQVDAQTCTQRSAQGGADDTQCEAARRGAG